MWAAEKLGVSVDRQAYAKDAFEGAQRLSLGAQVESSEIEKAHAQMAQYLQVWPVPQSQLYEQHLQLVHPSLYSSARQVEGRQGEGAEANEDRRCTRYTKLAE